MLLISVDCVQPVRKIEASHRRNREDLRTEAGKLR